MGQKLDTSVRREHVGRPQCATALVTSIAVAGHASFSRRPRRAMRTNWEPGAGGGGRENEVGTVADEDRLSGLGLGLGLGLCT